ncbi:MAG: DUF2273 domain-containing protein [Eubacteriales bacterium]|nr:DUF2273 domain-containing protein [Eubacteriales bacterium]MDD3882237.1 DUF2273 domain-containing protein [Eubacteriales bacterium]MDD4512586.1 DUF2273 domain-containing protein [Eubacteriales bacterium]
MKDDKSAFSFGTPACGVVCGIIGALIALFWLIFGFWKMLFVLAMFAAGYLIGAVDNKTEKFKRLIGRLVPSVQKLETPVPQKAEIQSFKKETPENTADEQKTE